MEEPVKKRINSRVLILAGVILIVVAVMLMLLLPTQEITPQVDITTTLERIVETSDLSTAVFQYQGIVEVPNPKKLTQIDYYICYDASIYAGIDFSKVKFVQDKENKTITATLPEVKILDTVVDPNSLDFMFQNKKADDISVMDVALTACETDIQQECTSESALLEVSRMNAENAVRALAEPVIEKICPGYALVIE